MKSAFKIISIVLVVMMALFMLTGCGSKETAAETEIADAAVPEAASPDSAANAVANSVNGAANSAVSAVSGAANADNGAVSAPSSGSTVPSAPAPAAGDVQQNVSNTVSQAFDTLIPAMTDPEGAWETYGRNTGNAWESYGENTGNAWENYGESIGNAFDSMFSR